MEFLKKIFKKFHSKKGITGTDIAAAITIIVTTMGVVTAIYINTTNKSKENLRYSNATRIATQIVENIQAETFDNLIYRCANGKNTISTDVDGKIFNVNIPKGYAATVTLTDVPDAVINVVVDIKIEVSYNVSNMEKKITLYTTKEKELLEQTNKPELELIDGYAENPNYYYPIKKVNSSYYVTDINDPEWYNYDTGNYALVLRTTTSRTLGSTVTLSSGTVYIWVPRFGITDNSGVLSASNLGYVYGTSKYKIDYGTCKNDDDTSIFFAYMLTYPDPKNMDENTKPNSITSYVSNTFTDNDGLTGVWYKRNDTTQNLSYYAFSALNNVNSCNND